MIPITDPEVVLGMDTSRLYATIDIMRESDELSNEDKTKITQVEQGIRVAFPIYYITESWYEPLPSSKSVRILGYGKIDIKVFYKEKQDRDRIMREIILNNIKDDSPLESRE